MVTHFNLLYNPDTMEKLKELEGAIPDKFAPAELSVVENLPYLVGCIATTRRGHH
jgi:hypothetical protein